MHQTGPPAHHIPRIVADMFATPDEAEAAYYRAFEQADNDLMSEVWLASDHVSCIHPLADDIHGHRFVLASWRAIFHNQGPTPITHTATEKHLAGPLAVHLGIETITRNGVRHSFLATNVFQLEQDGWCMLSHHASPKPRAGAQTSGVLH